MFDEFNIPGLLSDIDIEFLCKNRPDPMIQPFSDKLSEEGKISHGLSSYGYDATLAPVYKILTTTKVEIIDPKVDSTDCFEDHEGDFCIIPPHGFLLGHTKEIFDIPKDVLTFCISKSTYARVGLIVNVTPLEPGWRGQVTIEISNTTDLPAKVYGNEGICQFIFLRSARPCRTPYNKRGGKYMDQEGIVLSKILQVS